MNNSNILSSEVMLFHYVIILITLNVNITIAIIIHSVKFKVKEIYFIYKVSLMLITIDILINLCYLLFEMFRVKASLGSLLCGFQLLLSYCRSQM